jgi:hypothetical protein
MSRRGVSRSLHHFQELLEGRLGRVRRAVLEALERIVRDGLGLRDLDAEIGKMDSGRPDRRDLEWVRAEPVAGMARDWVSRNPGTSFRRLAIRVAEEVRKGGFPAGVSTIQPVLGGWKKKTRGFVYRAVALQVGRQADIPDEFLIRSPRREEHAPSASLDPNTLARRIRARAKVESKPGIESYARHARRFLGKPRCSPHLRGFLLLRMEKAYRVSRRRASKLLAPNPA